MRIRSLLSLTMSASLGLIFLLVATLWYSFAHAGKVNAALALAGDIRNTVLERVMLRDEYYIRREERPKAQWFEKTAILNGQLQRAKEVFRGANDRGILVEMVEESAGIESLFGKLVANGQATGMGGEYDKRLFSQLNIKAAVLRDDASRLVELLLGDLAALNKASDWLISACLAIVVTLVLVNGSLIGRILSRGIMRLQAGVSSIGEGNLEYRINPDADNEISEVGRGINRMAESLQGSFASVKELEREASGRAALLESSNDELEAFAYSVAHDLRAPLRSIEGFSRLLVEELGPATSAEALRILGIIRESAKKMDSLISSLLEISRIGRTALNVAPIDMRAMAGAAFSLIEGPELGGTFDFRVGELPEAEGDPPMIERVWTNLLSNAVKYSLPKPVHRIEVGGYAEAGMKVYSVEDQGVGFDPLYADKLFGMFERLHADKDFEGNGIGLAIVKRIISRHGGRVWAEGRPGEGATFYFALPARS